jgi:hypothetical protein
MGQLGDCFPRAWIFWIVAPPANQRGQHACSLLAATVIVWDGNAKRGAKARALPSDFPFSCTLFAPQATFQDSRVAVIADALFKF